MAKHKSGELRCPATALIPFFFTLYFSIFHSCIINREISVKNFVGTAQLRKVKFSTNIGNDKLYCVRNNQLSPAYVFPSVTQPKVFDCEYNYLQDRPAIPRLELTRCWI